MTGEPNLTFTREEFAHRVERLRERLRAAKVDVALFDEIEAMTWLSGYGNSENRWRCVGIPLAGEPFFLIRALDAGPCRQRTWIADVPIFRDWESPFAVLHETLALRGLARGRIGLDFNSYGMTLDRFARLKEALPDAEFVDLGPVVWELRLIKSEAEIALLRRAATVADEAMRRTAAACIAGVSQREAARVAVSSFVELGADPDHPGPISAGRGWDFLHAHLEDKPLVPGDIVHIELVPRVSGYSARIMRCAVIGEPSKELLETCDKLRAVQDRQIAALKVGARAADVDAILRKGLVDEGLRESVDNITGYTLGFYAAAGPRTSDFTRTFNPKAEWRIEPNMVFHMYASAKGASLSETVLVTDAGAECFSKLPRTLIVNT